MSGRKLGGGRILGSGKSLAPPAPLAHQRAAELISPAGSTVSSRDSDASPLTTSPLPEINQDLSSVVSLQNGSSSSVTAASTKLLCPICNEEMMTLLQLNRHLDDNHQELPEVEQDEVKNWFNKQVIKAKKFQPLAVINQKLKGLDVFESNEGPSITGPILHSGNRAPAPEQLRPDPDEVVTRVHWQKSGYNDLCTEPACGKRLGPVNGSVNCRKCGRLFCEDHTMYQMKLSRSAQHEPVRGFWCRVCETCYKSRDGYNDHNGFVNDHTNEFVAMRRKTVDKAYLEVSRLEKRLTKLTQLLAHPPQDLSESSGSILPLAGQKNQRKILEQSVVTWEEDAKVLKCPFCQQEFGSWSFRRHHCRLCGRVVCADPRTGCSSEVGLNVAATTDLQSEKPTDLSLDIRMCRDCKSTVFSKSDFAASLSHKPPDQRAYENLLQFEKGIRLLLPNFQRLIMALQDPDKPPSPSQLTDASKTRKRLIDAFGKYDLAAKRIRDLPSQSSTQLRLQKAIYQQSANFLNLHMLPLKSLPKILKHAQPPNGLPLPHGRSALASIKYNDIDSASQISTSSAEVSAMEAEEKELREKLIVLEEQRFMVQEMVAVARKGRKFDEVTALGESLSELEKEIGRVNGMVEGLDFRGVYEREGSGGLSIGQ